MGPLDELRAEYERLSAERDRYKEEADRRTREVEGTYRVQMKLEAESLAKERCGNCYFFNTRHGSGCTFDDRVEVYSHSHCHFIDDEHPHGRWELCDE